jgi:hypothetical protein
LLEILQRKNSQNLPDLTNWLQSTNDSVISFTLKLAKIFNQYDTKEQVLQLFDHPNIEIRIEAIELVSPLGFLKQPLYCKMVLENDPPRDHCYF